MKSHHTVVSNTKSHPVKITPACGSPESVVLSPGATYDWRTLSDPGYEEHALKAHK